jgi:transposase
MGTRRQYTDEFKKDAVRLMQARGSRTVADVAAGIGVNEGLLYEWNRKFGGEVFGQPTASEKEREEVERMRRRLRELEQENALLKKAAALFAREVK